MLLKTQLEKYNSVYTKKCSLKNMHLTHKVFAVIILMIKIIIMKSLNDLSSPNYFKKVIFFTKALDLAFVLIAIKKPLTVGISLPQILEKILF